jgi:hypothetical protein
MCLPTFNISNGGGLPHPPNQWFQQIYGVEYDFESPPDTLEISVLSASLADVSAPLADVSAHLLHKRRRQFTSPDQPIRSRINLHLIRFFFIGLISNCFNTYMGWNMILKALWFQSDLSRNFLPNMILAAQNCLKSGQSSQLNYGQMTGNLCSTLV